MRHRKIKERLMNLPQCETRKWSATSEEYAKTLLFVIAAFLYPAISQTQDLHFSQWFNSPLTTNPANTGFIPDADYRIGVNYRSQYVNILTVPYKTFSAFGDAQLFRDKLENAWMGVGGVILRDAAGSGNLTSTKVYGSLAYHQELGSASLLSVGFNLGWANKSINPSQLKFPDQFNKATGFFDAGIPSSVVFNTTNTNYLDVQIGMNYAYFPTDKVYINAGLSIQHVNRPRETFFSNTTGFDDRLAARYIGFFNASVKVSDVVILNPMGYYSNQAGASEFVIGGNLNYNLTGEGGATQLLAGIYYRSNDAIIPMLGFQFSNYKMTFTYDITNSSLGNYNNGHGAVEFSIVKQGFFSQSNGSTRQSLCPTF
jgi:type IX secretion system PorP/SprF family membrane protein